MVARVSTVAFQGIEAVPVDVQVQFSSGVVAFTVVGLAGQGGGRKPRAGPGGAPCLRDSPFRARRITVNMAPADLPKEGSHFDLPIALGLLAAMGVLPHDLLGRYLVLGELALDGVDQRRWRAPCRRRLPPTPAASASSARKACGPEAAWAGDELDILAPRQSDPARQSCEGHPAPVAAVAAASPMTPPPSPTSGTSRARKPPSGRSRWPPPAAIIC